jgi:hypothetical protein
MKKIKLIKLYPGSPKNLGITLTPKVDVNNNDANNFYWEGSWFNPSDFPEFWEEVIEKDYEVLISKVVPQEILSVKRLSDGEVFTVGDRAMTQGSRGGHSIRQFRVKQKCNVRTPMPGIFIKDGIDRIWIDWEEGCGGNWLESTEKLKQPIFLTHDGKDIFPEDTVWYVNKENLYYNYIITQATVTFRSDINAYFLTKEAASDYINKNKVLFTTEDGVGIKKDEVVYVVDGRLNGIDMISNFVPKDYPTMKAFSTSEAAEDYIIENKYALSIKDFWDITCMSTSNFNKNTYMKDLVKERLNLK